MTAILAGMMAACADGGRWSAGAHVETERPDALERKGSEREELSVVREERRASERSIRRVR